MKARQELTVVMPVYNEEACIGDVVDSWTHALTALRIEFSLLVINDGSRDGTAEKLNSLSKNAHVQVIHKTNSGHGPTILVGYRTAVEQSNWVFQVDSDNELGPGDFTALWERRSDFDVLLGYRVNRNSPWARRIITAGARWVVQMLFGKGIKDVNVPFRLIRSDFLRTCLEVLPDNLLAPNVCLTGLATRQQARIFQAPVNHRHRQTGVVSIRKLKLWKFAARTLWQTLQVSRSVKV